MTATAERLVPRHVREAADVGFALDAPPPSIRVGYRTYRVEMMPVMWSIATERYGECDHPHAVIRIWGHLDPMKAANTMLHALLHACWYVAGMEREDTEERSVTVLANQLTQVWRDNPALVAWISAALAEPEGR